MKATPWGIISLVSNANGSNCRNFLQKTIPFSSGNFYLWNAVYTHLSGNIPTVILMDKLNTYAYLKLYPIQIPVNDYFAIPFQGPESMLTNTPAIETEIQKTPASIVSGFLEPRPDQEDNQNKEFIIQHFSENAGAAQFQSLSLVDLPNYWPHTMIRPAKYQPSRFETGATIKSYQRVIPSLWKVTLEAEKNANYLLLFNEGYDRQWTVIGSKPIFHARCDSYMNCFGLNLKKGTTTLYLFYVPELLGWIGLVLPIPFLILLFKRNRKP